MPEETPPLRRHESADPDSPGRGTANRNAEAGFIPEAGGTVVVYLEPHVRGVSTRVADPSQPALLVTDQGVTRGDGIFETMLATAGDTAADWRVRKLHPHLERLAASAGRTGLTVPSAEDWRRAIEAGLRSFAAGNPGVDAVVKLVATRGPEAAPGGGHYGGGLDARSRASDTDNGSDTGTASRTGTDTETVSDEVVDEVVDRAPQPDPELTGTYWVHVSPVSAGSVAAREHGLKVLLLDRGYDSTLAERAPWLLMGAKTLSYAVNMAAMRHARAQGADDVIFVSADGKVLEGPTSTVLMVRRVPRADGSEGIELITPIRESGILPGTTQGAVFAAAHEAGWTLGYGPLEPEDLLDADGVWLVSSVRLVAPVTHLEGVALPVDPALTRMLNEFLDADLEQGEHGPIHRRRTPLG